MKKHLFTLVLALVLCAVLLAGCSGGSGGGDSTKLLVGATPAPHAEILELIKPKLAEEGIDLEIKEFNDYLVPNASVADGSLDANYFQHLPYLENYNAENDTDLVSAGGIHIEPLGIYPGRKASLDDMDGALIGIPNDPTNESRALGLLESRGYITLDENAGLEAVPSDIIDNPHNLTFTELEAAQLPATLPDLDFAIINGNYAVEANLGDKVLATEGAESPYVNVVAVRAGDEDRPEIQALVKALQSDEVRDYINDKYGGIVVPVF